MSRWTCPPAAERPEGVVDSIPVSSVPAAYTTLVGQMRANNPNMKILVAQIPAVSCTLT